MAVADFHVGGFARHKHKIHIRLADFSALEDSLQVDETRLLDVGGGVGKLLVLDVDGVGMRACWVDVESRVADIDEIRGVANLVGYRSVELEHGLFLGDKYML